MARSKSSPWIVGTALLCALLLGLAWLLLISPRLTAASDTRSQAAQVASQNEVLRARTAVLREQFENLDTYKAELAELRRQIPAEGQLAELIRTVEDLAEDAGVTAVSVGAEDASALVPAEPLVTEAPAPPAEPAPDGEEATSEEGGEEATPAVEQPTEPVPTAPAAIEGFVAVPLTISVLGDADDVREFIGSLQTGPDRLVLVDTVTATAMDKTEASGGRPGTDIGDLEVVLTAYAYVLQDLMLEVEPADAEAETELPRPRSGDNPFAPTARDGD